MTLPPPMSPTSDDPSLLPSPPPGPVSPLSAHGVAPGPDPSRANGLAIAALLCGLAFFVPGAGIVALVLGIIALRQLRARAQRGRGMAIAGIVLGSVTTFLWGLLFAAVIVWEGDEGAETGAPRPVGVNAPSGRVTLDQLRPGDCFSGIGAEAIDWAALSSCDDDHEMQLITTVHLGTEPFPGDDEVAGARAERKCIAAVEPLVDESALERVELFFLYPESREAWEQDPTALCIAGSVDGLLSGSVLK